MADNERIEWAYVIGGEPKQFATVRSRLFKLGINVAGHVAHNASADAVNVPKATTFILILSDQVRHTAADMARALAEKQDLPLVSGPVKSWFKVEERIRARDLTGQVEVKEPVVFENKAIADALARHDKEVVETATIPAANASPAEEKPVATSKSGGSIHQERSARIRAACKQVFEAHKHELKTYTNYEATEEVEKILGETNGVLSPSTVGKWRTELKYESPPKGYKRPGIRGKGGIRSVSSRATAVETSVAKGTASKTVVKADLTSEEQAWKDFDIIQEMLDEWGLKHRISKCYCAYDNGKWSVNFDVIKIVTTEKTYERKK